jgi:RNA polymerase sigma-70 factor (ECF subfamily)
VVADLDDIELMLGLKNGEAQFMEGLLKRHRNSLVYFLYRMVQDPAVAEELAQDVFLRVFRARENYEPSAHFSTWLYRIAANLAINWVRDSRLERNTLSLERLVVTRAAATATPEQELLRRERLRRVRAAIGTLPKRQRAAVLLHKYDELEYAQIAEVLGCSLSAVKSLLNRAYITLRQRLAAA